MSRWIIRRHEAGRCPAPASGNHDGMRWWEWIVWPGINVAIAAALIGLSGAAAHGQTTPTARAFNSSENEFICTAPLPRREGVQFGGVVRHVIDGDSLCVGPAEGDGATWIEVRLMDFDAPEQNQRGADEAEAVLSRIALARSVDCVVTRGRSGTTSYDRTHAVCRIGGRTIGDQMRDARAPEGGN